MDEGRWLRFLFRQQARGLRYFDTTRINTKDLPLDTEDAIVGLSAGDEELALRDLGDVDLTLLSDAKLDAIHERTQDRFTARIRRLTQQLLAGTITLLAWHRLMRDEVKLHLLQQALLGGHGAIRDPQRVSGAVRQETDYLSRFADELARSGDVRRAVSRAAMYGGSGRAAYYRERESALPHGYYVEYVARDDDGTCDPCMQAQGFYLPGEGPYPGQVCLGRARCRCVRLIRYDRNKAIALGVRF